MPLLKSTFILVRNLQQQFCSRRPCQNVRKSKWRREKHQREPDYLNNQNQASKGEGRRILITENTIGQSTLLIQMTTYTNKENANGPIKGQLPISTMQYYLQTTTR